MYCQIRMFLDFTCNVMQCDTLFIFKSLTATSVTVCILSVISTYAWMYKCLYLDCWLCILLPGCCKCKCYVATVSVAGKKNELLDAL